jgi:branched-chain amino acid transport system permease protein
LLNEKGVLLAQHPYISIIKEQIMGVINSLITGLSLGSVYAIIALGYTMVYGISKMLNFAHGDVIMVGAYISFLLTNHAGMNAWVSLLIAIAVCTILGMLIERLAYRPLRGTGSLAVLITAIGVSYFLQNAALLLWGADPRMFNSIFGGFKTIHLADGALTITPESMFTILANIIIMIALTLFVSKTKAGKAMRAVSEDNGAAQLMGINVNQSISLTFAIGSGLAAIAGVLMCSAYPVLIPTTGAMPGIKAFTAAVFGGIGSIPGAMIGGLILGIIEIFSRAYISSELADAIVFACLIIVLLIKPTGLLGKKVSEKV